MRSRRSRLGARGWRTSATCSRDGLGGIVNDPDAWEALFKHNVAWEYFEGLKPRDAIHPRVCTGAEFLRFRHLDELQVCRGMRRRSGASGGPCLVLGHSHEIRCQAGSGPEPEQIASSYLNCGTVGRFENLPWGLEIRDGVAPRGCQPRTRLDRRPAWACNRFVTRTRTPGQAESGRDAAPRSAAPGASSAPSLYAPQRSSTGDLESQASVSAERALSAVRGGLPGGSGSQREGPLAGPPPRQGGPSLDPALPRSVREELAAPGAALDGTDRRPLERAFGFDFRRVRVHAGARAAASARDVQAQAYTVGRHIVFGEARYRPRTDQGRALLAHELAHVVQSGTSSTPALQRFSPEDAAVEMVGRSFTLNAAVTVGGTQLPSGTTVVIQTWSNSSEAVTVRYNLSGGRTGTGSVGKNFLTPVGGSSGLYQYGAGVGTIETAYASLTKQIEAKNAEIVVLNAQEGSYTTPAGHAEWQRQKDTKTTELHDLQYKLNGGGGYTPATLPERLKTKVNGQMVSITPKSVALNRALIEQTMFNAFDQSIVTWVNTYNTQIGAPLHWPALDANIVKSMLYQESHLGTQGDFLLPPPYGAGQRMTRFNIGQAIDSSGPQQILMIKEISPAIDTKYHLDDVERDRVKAQSRFDELEKQSALSTTEQAELATLNQRSNNGDRWNDYYTTDPRWTAAVQEFFAQTSPTRNLSYDYWIRTTVRWLFEKRKTSSDWAEAIKAYNGSGPRADTYKKDVIGRRDAAKAAKGEFKPVQHY